MASASIRSFLYCGIVWLRVWAQDSRIAVVGFAQGDKTAGSKEPFTHRPHSSCFLGFPYRILNMNPKKELLWGPWVEARSLAQLR